MINPDALELLIVEPYSYKYFDSVKEKVDGMTLRELIEDSDICSVESDGHFFSVNLTLKLDLGFTRHEVFVEVFCRIIAGMKPIKEDV